MCKETLARAFSKQFGVTIKKAKEMFDFITYCAQTEIANGSYFIVPGICKISTRDVNERKLKHIKTRKMVVVKAYKFPRFRPLGKFKKFVKALPQEDK